MDAYLRERADRPFGDTELVAGQVLKPFSEAGMAAAENLLAKAERALAERDQERARQFVHRAAALRYDAHEETAPAAFVAGMMLFDAVVDTLEDSPEGDSRWLDAAVEALSSAEGWGRSELRHVLLVVLQEYDVGRGESRAISGAVADVPERPELGDAMLPQDELLEAVTSVLQTLKTYREAVAAAAG